MFWILKIIKHIVGISQLLVFLAFVAIGGLQGLLQSKKNSEADHLHISVQNKQSTSFEQGVFEIDVEKESEGGEFLKHAACFCNTQTFLKPVNTPVYKEIKPFAQLSLHAQPIFLELHNFRI